MMAVPHLPGIGRIAGEAGGRRLNTAAAAYPPGSEKSP